MTTCVSPPELDDSQLLSYLDDKTDDAIASHLRRCPHCQTKADRLERFQSRLTARLYRIDCPPPAELANRHLGLLDASRSQAIDRHVHQCPRCALELEQLKAFLANEVPFSEPSPLDRVKVLIARLISGSGKGWGAPVPALAGIRGATRGPITLEADGIVIVLDIQPADEEHVTILGQVAADDQDRWTGATVELRQAGELRMTVAVDDLGAFRCVAFPLGPTEILITPSNGDAVLVPNVEITV